MPSDSSTEKMVDDVRVIESGDGAGFALETGEALGIPGGLRGKDFESDIALEFGVGSAIDLARRRRRRWR